MPSWSVTEPYIDLWLTDTPMSYTLSSGKQMDFSFYYRTGYKVPDEDEVPDFYYVGASPQQHIQGDFYYAYARKSGTGQAAWSHNWMKDIIFWNSGSENSWISQISQPGGYEALLFDSQADVQYFYSTNGAQILQESRSKAILQPASGLGYPTVNTPVHDTNYIFWGDTQTNGFRMLYPDGSIECFGLCYYPAGLTYQTTPSRYAYTGAHAFLTERIDPQGRVTHIGYEYAINTNYNSTETLSGYRVKYVVDSDGRTNTFLYANNNNVSTYSPVLNPWALAEIDDPFGRKVQLGYAPVVNLVYGPYYDPQMMYVPRATAVNNGVLTSITDAAGMTSTFQYQATPMTYGFTLRSSGSYTNIPGYAYAPIGAITNLTTPYGNTGFGFYEVDDTNQVGEFVEQKAIYVSEPAGANQLFYFLHRGLDTNGNSLLAAIGTAPTVPGQTNFDDGYSGSIHPTLNYRNSIHWGRLQYTSLSSNVQALLPSSISNAVAVLTTNDFRKGRVRNWLWQPDGASVSESISSERDPSPDPTGKIEGLRTWYNYGGKPSSEIVGSNPQITCVAKVLPDGTSQYVRYNYSTGTYANGLVSDSESSYSAPGGTVGEVTNWFIYAGNGIDVTSISNSTGQYVNFGYNGIHQVTSITNALNQVTTVNWDAFYKNLSAIQWPDGNTINYSYYVDGAYDTNGDWVSGINDNLLSGFSWSPSGRSVTVNGYYMGLPASLTDDRGVTVTNTWDGLNRLTSTVFPDNTSVSNIYNRLDLVASKDRLTHWTYYAYDGLQHLTSVTNANNAVTTYSWCGCGSLTGIMDAYTNLTSLYYDNQGHLTNAVYPDFSSLTWQYDLAGRMTNIFDGATRTVQLAYDNQGLPTSIAGVNGTLQAATYDALGRPIQITDPNGVTVTNSFDAINEVTRRTWPDGFSESYGYSAAGLIAYTNRAGKSTLYGRDGAGRLTSVTNANLEVTQFGYDSLNNVVSLIDGLQHQTTWHYNEYGWLTNKVDGLNRIAFRYAYNANGWVTNRWTPEKGNTGYAYDSVGNVTTITYPQRTNTYAYDALNRLTNMADATGSHVFGYTAASLLQSESGPWANDTVSYAYTQGLRTVLTLAQTGTNWVQSYGYDAGWRLTNVVSPAGTFAYSYNFQPSSTLVSGIALPNGASITNGYDSLGRLTQTALNNYWSYTLDGYGYKLDSLGLRTNVVRNLGLTNSSVTAGYDNIGQLTVWAAKEASGIPRLNEQLGWAYDAAHNLHTRNNGNLAQTFTTDAANQLNSVGRTGTFTLSGATPAPATNVTVNGQPAQIYNDFTFACTNLSLANGANSFTSIAQNVYGLLATNTLTLSLPTNVSLTYDNNGNLTNDGTRSFAYDADNQLTNVTLAGSWRSDFVYDGMNRRRIERDFVWQSGVWRQTNEIHYIYDGSLILQERDASNHVLVTYTRGLDFSGSLKSAGGIGGLLARTDTNSSTFYHTDGSGNITTLMDVRQNIVARYLYSPFGQLLAKWGALANANEMQFSSVPQQILSGLSFYTHRGYNPNLQRWLSQDPIGEWGGIDVYESFFNSPLNYVDRNGDDNIWNMGAGNNAPVNISINLPNNSNPGETAYNGPWLSSADPNSTPYAQPHQEAIDGLILGSDMNPSSPIVQDFARDVQSPLYSSLVPFPWFKTLCPNNVSGIGNAKDLGIPDFLSPRQKLHIPPVNDGRSVLTANPSDLLKGLHDGEFTILRQPKPGQVVVDFGAPIGEYWSQGVKVGETQFGSVMYGKKGVHIVPANPNQW